jgi:hypothetical protein
MRPWLAAVAALIVLLSGCSGGGSDPREGPAPAASGKALEAASGALVPAPLVLRSDLPLNGTILIDDAFPTADTCNSNPARGCVERPHDLGGQLPPGVPVEVAVDLTWPAGDRIFHMEAWLDGDGMMPLRVDNTTFEGDHWRWTALVVPGPTSKAVVIAGGPQSAAQPADSPYHLEVTFTASNQTVPAFVPVAIDLGPSSTLSATSFTGAAGKFVLYGPDDQFIQDVVGNITLPEDAVRGDYLALPRESVTFMVPGGGDLRFAGILFTSSDMVTIPPGSAASATVSTELPPFLAGAYYHGQQQTPFMFAVQLSITLTDPDGTELVAEQGCQPFCFGGFSSSWSTGFGKPLKAGSYTITAESQAAADTYAGAYLVTFDRSTL